MNCLCKPTGASLPAAPTPVSPQPPGSCPTDSPDAIPLFFDRRPLLSFNPLSGYRSGLQSPALRLGLSVSPPFGLECLNSFACLLPTMPFADSSTVFSANCSTPSFDLQSTGEASRGKTRYLRGIDAGFTKCTPTADGGLRGHVPARPRCITPTIRFLFIAPPLRIGLPPDPASRRRPCPSPCLRLCENLAIGLSPTK